MKASKNIVFSIATMAVGLACIVFAIIAFSYSVYAYDGTEYVGNITYGGDAYTGMQNASAATARNISDLASMVRALAYDFEFMFDCFGFIILIAGCLIALSGVQNFMECLAAKKAGATTEVKEVVKETVAEVAETTSFEGVNI